MCGLLVTTDTDRREVLSVKPDLDDPLSRGGVCPKAFALPELHNDPDRLRTPMRRVGDAWEAMAWDAALDLAAERIHAVQVEHGRDTVATYLGNPNVHNLGCVLFAPAFVRMVSKTRFSATSLDQLPHQLVAWQMFGHQLMLPIPDVDRTDFLLIVGANPVASGGSIMTAPDVRKRLKQIQGRGGRVVVVDPRRTETAKVADTHHFVRPGTDAVWLAAVLRELLANGSAVGRLAPVVKRLDVLCEAVDPWTPERAAERCGISADDLRALARDFAAAPSAVVYGRLGVSTHPFGSVCQWLVNAINLVTGNLDRPGGALFTTPAVDVLRAPPSIGLPPGSISKRTTRVRKLPAVLGEYPSAAMGEEMDTPGEGRIRALVTIAGNPVLSAPNGRRIEAAIGGLDFQLAIDPYINETTRQADLILPPVTPLERSHYDLVFHALAVRNTAKFNDPVLAMPEGGRHDWQILHGIETRLGALRKDSLGARSERWVRGKLGPERNVELGLRLSGRKLSIAKLRASPSGVDLGPLEPTLPGRLPTGSIDAAPELLVSDMARLEVESEPAELRLIGRRNDRDCNSWMHNLPTLMRGKDRCTLQMHPEDATRYGVAAGGQVSITSRVGTVEAPVEVTDAVMPGVVSLPHGFGHGRPGTQMRVAAAHAGVSINDLTDDQAIDVVSGNAAFVGIPVTVAAAPS
jgi:anaerobic selenocysteine-containing dehydrogenase